ncbi:MAG: 50S ribosomal protein L6 [Nanoarchaeota archaeon]
MKQKIQEELEIPSGFSCGFDGKIFNASKGSVSLSKKIDVPSIKIEIKGNKIHLSTEKGNKKELKYIKSSIAHIKNMFLGLENKFVYKLEACNVHFPMTLKVEGNYLLINNFLGEKVPRRAKIMSGVDIEVKGAKITISSHNKEAAGETAANIEKATKIKNRDRRIFQDGIFIVEKPQGVKK